MAREQAADQRGLAFGQGAAVLERAQDDGRGAVHAAGDVLDPGGAGIDGGLVGQFRSGVALEQLRVEKRGLLRIARRVDQDDAKRVSGLELEGKHPIVADQSDGRFRRAAREGAVA